MKVMSPSETLYITPEFHLGGEGEMVKTLLWCIIRTPFSQQKILEKKCVLYSPKYGNVEHIHSFKNDIFQFSVIFNQKLRFLPENNIFLQLAMLCTSSIL